MFQIQLQESQLAILFFQTIQNEQDFVKLLCNHDFKFIKLNVKYIASIKQLLLVFNRVILQNPQDIQQFQHCFLKLIAPSEHQQKFTSFYDNQPFIYFFYKQKADLEFEKQLKSQIISEQLDLENLDRYIDLKQIIDIYQINQQEIELDTHILGSVYNYISLNNFDKKY